MCAKPAKACWLKAGPVNSHHTGGASHVSGQRQAAKKVDLYPSEREFTTR
jgi:hypothetical protein